MGLIYPGGGVGPTGPMGPTGPAGPGVTGKAIWRPTGDYPTSGPVAYPVTITSPYRMILWGAASGGSAAIYTNADQYPSVTSDVRGATGAPYTSYAHFFQGVPIAATSKAYSWQIVVPVPASITSFSLITWYSRCGIAAGTGTSQITVDATNGVDPSSTSSRTISVASEAAQVGTAMSASGVLFPSGLGKSLLISYALVGTVGVSMFGEQGPIEITWA